MKKLKHFTLTLLFFVGITALTTGCKKDWQCQCKTVQNGQTTTNTRVINNMKKKDAKVQCEGNNDTYKKMNLLIGVSTECHLQ